MIEAAFRDALLNPDVPAPSGLVDPAGRAADRRFAVYRNNVAMSLQNALAQAFPLLRQLVGETFFAAMAAEFRRAHLPSSRLVWQYGEQMPNFLQAFPPVAHLPYLPDVARLEIALRNSYHAADCTPLPAETLSAIPPDRLLSARLRLAPALQVLPSRWPVFGIWQAHAAGAPAPAMEPQDVVVLRPAFDPAPVLLPPGGAAFIGALIAGQTVAAAMDAAGPDHPLPMTLTLLLTGGAISEILEDTR